MSIDQASTASCVDAERLAAWSEGALPATEAADVELHLSNCARCQAMLAAFARSEPVVPATLPFRTRMPLRWVVPLAAAAAVVVWVAVGRRELSSPAEQMVRTDAPAAPLGQRAQAQGADASIGAPIAPPIAATREARIERPARPVASAPNAAPRPAIVATPNAAPIEAPREVRPEPTVSLDATRSVEPPPVASVPPPPPSPPAAPA